MNRKYIIGIAILVCFGVMAMLSFNKNKIEYSDIISAKKTSKTVQIIATWNKEQNSYYDSKNNLFTFFISDEKKNSAKVEFTGMKPNNFETAPSIVIRGKFESDIFKADQILTQCPSKYNDGSKMQ